MLRSLYCPHYSLRYFASFAGNALPNIQKSKVTHCYKSLFPWKDENEFNEHLANSVIYNKNGLVAINKPFGIKVHGHDKPGTRYENSQRYVIPSIKDCDFTVEDALPLLEKHLNITNLRILKSAERYTSGVVLIGSSDEIAAKVTKSFEAAKRQKKPHLIHWGITVGFSAASYREEKVGIKFVEIEKTKEKQPVILTNISNRAFKKKIVYPVRVESKTLCINEALSTSLIQIASSSVKWHFVRLYASSRMAPILGDIMYGSRMKILLGIPVKVPMNNHTGYGIQEIPNKLLAALDLPKGENGIRMIPTMLHLRSILLPDLEEKGKDVTVTAELPYFFQWTTERLNLIS